MTTSLSLYEIALPLRRSFSTASGSIGERRTIIVGIRRGGMTGWGEAAPFPEYTKETIDDVWNALASPHRTVHHLPPTAAAALAEAVADLTARIAGDPLWRTIGGRRTPLRASLAIGIASTIAGLLTAVEEAVTSGYTAAKLKIRPGHALEPVRAVRREFPEVRLGVDANGSYAQAQTGDLERIADLGIEYIEQPFDPADLGAHSRLRDRVGVPICLDESAFDPDAALRALDAGAADVIAVKPGLLGTAGAVDLVHRVVQGGGRLKASGLLESSVGKLHTIALATLEGFDFYDISIPESTFTSDVVHSAFAMLDGFVMPALTPGIGAEPDLGALENSSKRRVDMEPAFDLPLPPEW